MIENMKPMSFNTDMVCALLDGSKTVTRRIMKPQPEMEPCGMWHWKDCQWMDGGLGFPVSGIEDYAPHHPGNILYVRETWDRVPVSATSPDDYYFYKADGDMRPSGWRDKWRPSAHMPREAARIFLRVTDVRVERLQDMTDVDCANDGGFELEAVNAVGKDALFGPFWDSTIKKKIDRGLYGWEANPWVWVITFERVSREEVNKEVNSCF